MNLDSVVDHFERLLEREQSAIFSAIAAGAEARQELAKKAVREKGAILETHIGEQLQVRPEDLPPLDGLLRKVVSYRFADVVTLWLDPPFADVSVGTDVKATAILELAGEFEVDPFGETVRVGLGKDVAVYAPAFFAPAEAGGWRPPARAVKVPFLISVDLTLVRTEDGYKDLSLSDVRPISSARQELIAERHKQRPTTELGS